MLYDIEKMPILLCGKSYNRNGYEHGSHSTFKVAFRLPLGSHLLRKQTENFLTFKRGFL